jgi:hypothetical protein
MYVQVATLFAVMQDTEYMQKEIFKDNFWNDWRELLGENHVIQNLKDCDFTPIYDWCQIEKDKKKQMSSEVNCLNLLIFYQSFVSGNESKLACKVYVVNLILPFESKWRWILIQLYTSLCMYMYFVRLLLS